MSASDLDKEITRYYRELMREELSQPEVKAGKDKLLALYSPQPSWAGTGAMSWAFLVGICLIGVLVYPYFVEKPVEKALTPPQSLVKSSASRPEQPAAKAKKPKSVYPQVKVKKATSKAGSVLVYQKMYQKEPFTIVWVFPGGKVGA